MTAAGTVALPGMLTSYASLTAVQLEGGYQAT